MIIPYEEPTDELRQVVGGVRRETCCLSTVGDATIRVQRKWRIYKIDYGSDYLRVWSQSSGGGPSRETYTEEWRDLPTVTEDQVSTEQGKAISTI